MGIGAGIGNSIPRGITGDAGFSTQFFEILQEDGSFMLSEDGAPNTYLITEQQ